MKITDDNKSNMIEYKQTLEATKIHAKTTTEKNYNTIAVEKAVKKDERNTETTNNMNITEVRDNISMTSSDITYCGVDHLKEGNTLTDLIWYDNK